MKILLYKESVIRVFCWGERTITDLRIWDWGLCVGHNPAEYMWWVQPSFGKTVPSGTSTELEGNTCNGCQTRTARMEMHFDEDARPGKIKYLRLWIWKQNYVKRVHHLSIMSVDPVRASYARHQVCRRIEYQC